MVLLPRHNELICFVSYDRNFCTGHKNIKNTLVYTHLVNFESDDFISKVGKNAEDACKLVEAGFDYVCTTPENLLVFKKRK